MCSHITNQYGEKTTGKTLKNKSTDIHCIHVIMFITVSVVPPAPSPNRPRLQEAWFFQFCNRLWKKKNSPIHLKYFAVTCYVTLKAFQKHLISVHWFKKFCNVSIYPSFVIHFPEDSHISGRNMWEAHHGYNIRYFYTFMYIRWFRYHKQGVFEIKLW